MHPIHRVATILAVVFSVTFALLLYPAIVGDYGVLQSVAFVLLGVAVIWAAYFGLGSLFGHLYQEGRKEGREDSNSDFV
jgi:hypothetical protein